MNNSNITSSSWEEKSIPILAFLFGIFFLSKLYSLNVPLFHDELGFYGRAIFYMFDHGPSMMPGDIDPYLSRGHPLFFVFFISWVSSWFGSTYIPARFVVLLISIGLLITTYLLGKEINNKKVGLLATIVLSFQPLFFAQSTFLLPEVTLAFLGMLSLLFYLRKQYIVYFIFASLTILTKETGIVLFAGIGLNEWYKNRFRINLALIGRVLKWAAPFSCFIIFLFIQKYQNGWFLFPYHTGLMSFDALDVFIRFILNILVLFLDQGRFILLTAVIISLFKMGKEDSYSLFKRNALPISVCIMMIIFSSLNYFMVRYLMLVMPLVIIMFVSILEHRKYRLKHLLIYFALTLPFQFSFLIFRQDNDMGYMITVRNMQASISELDKRTNGKPILVYARFPELNALNYTRDGYTNNPNYILTDLYSDSVAYVLKSDHGHLAIDEFINDMEYVFDNNLDSIINNPNAYKNSGFELIYESKLFYNHQRLYMTNNPAAKY